MLYIYVYKCVFIYIIKTNKHIINNICSCSCPSIYLSICKLQSAAILRDFLGFGT